MGLKQIYLRGSYTGRGKDILENFLLPALNESTNYNRITGYYTIDSLLAISQGIESLYEKNGTMRLIIGIHSIPSELSDAVLLKERLKNEIKKLRLEIQKGILSLDNALDKKRIVTLAWMIEDGLLTVKAAAVKGTGIFHPKTLIFSDNDNNEVVAVGSSNETANGLGGNFEQLMVAKSWENHDAVDDQKRFFDALWDNRFEDVYVEDISENTREMISEVIGDGYNRRLLFEDNVISKMSQMPANFFISGDIPSLYMHQERAVIDALSRWPVRVLLSDEVGLGKTFEAAATLAFLVRYSGIKRVVILTPKSVLQQWQDELFTHFGLDAWLYDSSKKKYISANGKIINIGGNNPLGNRCPNLILMSAQYARGSSGNNSVFLKSDSILPELLIVDEAHSARVSTELSGKRQKTQMYKMLEALSKKIPHLILATATPMQKDAFEYHAMLKLLGLPKIWEKEENYDLSLKIISSSEKPDSSDAVNAGTLLYSTLTKMNPLLDSLSKEERKLTSYILNSFKSLDAFDRALFIQKNWKCFKSVFIKLHPAKLLTVRNTRKSLIDVGYKFPKRNLKEVNLYNSNEIEDFYQRVDSYLSNECFSIEKALYPDKKISIGFVRTSYQQRVASSLYSCKESLKRRFDRSKSLLDELYLKNTSALKNNFNFENFFDDFDEDELCLLDEEFMVNNNHLAVNNDQLIRAISIERAALGSLLIQAENLLKTFGDKKINESLDLALKTVLNGDSVLLFSRYTDTINALIKKFKELETGDSYAIYTGDRSIIVENGIEKFSDKNSIKKALFTKKIRIVFCSDAASEGLNLQAARVLINVDVPWTPARLEQRIGRIARLGQAAPEVDVYNVWYPHSIEAKMYSRIQKRLRETNIAVGDFPEVVSAGIKRAILQNESIESNLDELKRIRNSYQTQALETLWVNKIKHVTASEKIRKDLIQLCKDKFDYTESFPQKYIISFEMPNGKKIELTDKCGEQESINLKSLPFKYIDLKAKGIKFVNNEIDKIVYFSTENGEPVLFENILDIGMSQRNIVASDVIAKWPKTLLRPQALNLKYAIECKINEPPLFWEIDEVDD